MPLEAYTPGYFRHGHNILTVCVNCAKWQGSIMLIFYLQNLTLYVQNILVLILTLYIVQDNKTTGLHIISHEPVLYWVHSEKCSNNSTNATTHLKLCVLLFDNAIIEKYHFNQNQH